jgi:thiamine biosynthesis lipoprotein
LRRAFVEQIMGLPVSIHVRGLAAQTNSTAELVHAAFADLRRVDELFSTYRPDSQVSQINAGNLSLAAADPLVHEVAALAELAWQDTGGLFSTYLPDDDGVSRFDPSGIVKGWAGQREFDLLADGLVNQDICLNVGGDVVVSTAAGGAPWRIGIEDPLSKDLLAVLSCSHGAVATSGTHARGAHLIDPRDGSHPTAVRQVTVTGPSLLWADILATAAFVRGPTAAQWLGVDYPGYEALVIDSSGAVTTTSGLQLE